MQLVIVNRRRPIVDNQCIVYMKARCSMSFLSVRTNLRKWSTCPIIWLLRSYCSQPLQVSEWVSESSTTDREEELARQTVPSSCTETYFTYFYLFDALTSVGSMWLLSSMFFCCCFFYTTQCTKYWWEITTNNS